MQRTSLLVLTAALVFTPACMSPEAGGLAEATAAATTVKMDFYHRPLPEIPLPNDIATTADPTSATGRRVNASMLAPTQMERRVRGYLDDLDGWGTLQPIVIPFTGPLDIESILAAHRDVNYDPADDVIYLINIDRDSAKFGELRHLDLGNGNYPVVLEGRDKYWQNDPRGDTISILFEETNEDLNGNGILEPFEDTDADGVLDVPNYLPGATADPTDPNDLAARADAMMSFYERETSTLIARPMMPLDERTTYAVVVTRRLLDEAGDPVGSPYPFINHNAQTEALRPLLEVLPDGVAVDDIAYTFSFTTQTTSSSFVAVRDGLYGYGVQAHLAREFPAEVATLEPLLDSDDATNVYVLPARCGARGCSPSCATSRATTPTLRLSAPSRPACAT
jgi:hypothetical protein